MRTGAPWRDPPAEFGAWNSIWRQFRRWADTGIWDTILEAFGGSAISDAALQMIDATIERVSLRRWRKRGQRGTRLGARAVVSQAKSALGPMPMDFQSAS